MTRSAVSQTLEQLNIHPDKIPDRRISQAISVFLELIEGLSENNEKLKEENQKLRDENNLLKGEQAKPNIAASKNKDKEDTSSEKERKARQPNKDKKSKAKKHKIKIDRTKPCKVDQSSLPEDAEFKGYQEVVVQEISIKTDNVLYRREVYYSASQKKTYLGALPAGVEGEFGNGVKSLVYTLKHVANMSEPKVGEFLENVGIYISAATISRILTKKNDIFHQEKEDIFRAGLSSTDYQQIDDTAARVKGENQHVQIICNPYYSAYFTMPNKDRLSIIDLLSGGKARSYHFGEEAYHLLSIFRVSPKVISKLESRRDKILNEEQMAQLLDSIFSLGKGKNQRRRIMEAAAICAYHRQTDFPVVSILLSDDAPQFKHIVKKHGLCWVHDGRHYKKLQPVVPLYREELATFRERFWDYYQKLLDFKENPSEQRAEELSKEFDRLFASRTGYKALDERIAKSKAKKDQLLMVLRYPELPLHNNASELGARAQARRRDVSFHTMTKEGTMAMDTFLTIVQTAKKLGVSSYEYIYDRVSGNFNLPSLAELIREQSYSASFCYHTGFS